MAFGIVFVIRLLNSSTKKPSSSLLSTSFSSHSLMRTKTRRSRRKRTTPTPTPPRITTPTWPSMTSRPSSPSSMGNAIPPTLRSGWVCSQILSPAHPHTSLPLKSLDSSRSLASLMLTLRIVSRSPNSCTAQASSPQSRTWTRSKTLSTTSPLRLACPLPATRPQCKARFAATSGPGTIFMRSLPATTCFHSTEIMRSITMLKEVVVMGDPSFTNYLSSIQAKIGILNYSVDHLEQWARGLVKGVEAGGDDAQTSVDKLAKAQGELTEIRTKIAALKDFFIVVKKRWSKLKNRVIGHVVWAPPIAAVPPHCFMRDLCVIKLNKKKFQKFTGNVLSLGPEISSSQFKALMYDRIGVPSEFKYPDGGLLPVQGILSIMDSNKSLEGECIRRVIKRGSTTKTTIGTTSKFMSHVRKNSFTGNLDSVEVAIFCQDSDFVAFSRAGDSGALIIDAHHRFIAMLTGGTNKGTDSSDITFATPMEWIWYLIKEKFPGANLYFDDLKALKV